MEADPSAPLAAPRHALLTRQWHPASRPPRPSPLPLEVPGPLEPLELPAPLELLELPAPLELLELPAPLEPLDLPAPLEPLEHQARLAPQARPELQ